MSDHNSPPGWLNELNGHEEGPKLPQVPFGEVAYKPGTREEWRHSSALQKAITAIPETDLKMVEPSIKLNSILPWLSSNGIQAEPLPGFESVFDVDGAGNVSFVHGLLKFEHAGHLMYAVVVPNYDGYLNGSWALMCSNVAHAQELMVAYKMHIDSIQVKRRCFIVKNRTQQSNDLLLEIDRLTWDDLVMDKALKADLREACESVFSDRSAAIYKRMGLARKKGIIVHGPPGNGKTMTGKVIAAETGASLIYVTTSRQSGFMRDTKPAEVFEMVYSLAKDIAPCVVMLEEIDGLLDADSRPVLLTLLDGLAPNDSVLTIATTNHLERLDPAITNRPNRFDRIFKFEYPGFEPRRDYLERKMRQAFDITPEKKLDRSLVKALNTVAKGTEGLSFSHLQEISIGAGVAVAERSEEKPAKALMMSYERVRVSFPAPGEIPEEEEPVMLTSHRGDEDVFVPLDVSMFSRLFNIGQ
jgi:AAA+ superfamily predicted ATPase